MKTWMWMATLALAACNNGDTEDEGSFCMAGELDCTCTPATASGCDDGLECNADNVCVEADSDADSQ